MTNLLELFLEHPSVTIDSRSIKKDQIFFAIKGENFDGNDYVLNALQSGASYCVASDPKFTGEPSVMVVPDTLIALQELAHQYRSTFDIPVLAITGSNGKTTTKELLSKVLSTKFKTHMTRGNYNNHLGVPLTLLEMPVDSEFGIIEMGANHIGEIKDLCVIAAPDHGIVTNIGIAHLEGFGGVEGVKKAKSELYEYLQKHNGLSFYNGAEPSVQFLENGQYGQILNISSHDNLDLKLAPTSSGGCLNFTLNGILYNTNLIGNYNFNNILVAIGIGNYFNCDPQQMARAVADYIPENNRSQQKLFKGAKLIMDAYNANPSSMHQAIANLAADRSEIKSLVLGDMLELGELSGKFHLEILDQVQKSGNWRYSTFVGPHFYEFKDSFPEFTFFKSTADAISSWNWDLYTDHVVLIKGSRGLKLESLIS